jgi:two-component system CheB/CheR fusion protein
MARAMAARLRDHRVFNVDDLEKIAELVNQGANDARKLARGLHAADVDSAGLMTALRDLVSRQIWNTPCRLEVKNEPVIHDDTVASHLYRLVREAVINANKHARAKEIVVKITRSRNQIIVSVSDNGGGIPAGTSNSEGLGFHIMKYRARSIGARLEIKPGPRGGTRVACYLPQRK